ncbi:uncharacterized protein LOC144146420 [Haemaphysalis longicornis]
MELNLYISGQDDPPAIIALQETNGKPRLLGYVTYTDPSGTGTAVLVRNNVAATQHVTAQSGREHTLVEVPAREIGSTRNIFVMSAYCRPSQRQYDFDRTVQEAKSLAGTRPLLILGDFNAPHTLWGYKFLSKRGKALVRTMEDQDLVLPNEPGVTTRRGNSVARDTTSDLSWLAGSLDASWRCEEVDLGSDHSIISITVRGPCFRAELGKARITDWDKIRKFTQEDEDATGEDAGRDYKIQSYEE